MSSAGGVAIAESSSAMDVDTSSEAVNLDAILKPYRYKTGRLERERKKKALRIETEQLNRALRELEMETHAKYQEKIKELEETKQRRLEQARDEYELLDQSTMVVYKYECDEAETEYNTNCEKLKNELLDDVEAEIRRYKVLLGGKSKHTKKSHKNTRTTRSRGKLETSSSSRPTSATTGGKPRKRSGAMFPSVRVNLLRSEIDKDIQRLIRGYKNVVSTRQSRDGEELQPARVKICRNRLFYNNTIVEDGDEVLVEYVETQDSVGGIVSAMSSPEVFLLREDGAIDSFNIMDLRSGKATLVLITDSSGNEYEDGY